MEARRQRKKKKKRNETEKKKEFFRARARSPEHEGVTINHLNNLYFVFAFIVQFIWNGSRNGIICQTLLSATFVSVHFATSPHESTNDKYNWQTRRYLTCLPFVWAQSARKLNYCLQLTDRTAQRFTAMATIESIKWNLIFQSRIDACAPYCDETEFPFSHSWSVWQCSDQLWYV